MLKIGKEKKRNELEKVLTLSDLIVYMDSNCKNYDEMIHRYNDFTLKYTGKECQREEAVKDMINYLKENF